MKSFKRLMALPIVVLGTLPLMAGAQSAAEKSLSTQAFSIVAPFPPGGPIDSLARALATGLTERYHLSLIHI